MKNKLINYVKYLSLIICLYLSIAAIAQERLTSRFTYFSGDSQCSQYASFCWQHKIVTNNRAVLNYTIDKGLYYKYTPNFKGLSGSAEVFIYKYTGSENFDNNVLVEIVHAGRIDSLVVDFTSKKDHWESIGKFSFNGDGKEFIRFIRVTDNSSKIITPILPIRFDLYYNTMTRLTTVEESNIKLPIGLSKVGHWKSYTKSSYRPKYLNYVSKTKEDSAIWNPGFVLKGNINIYLYRPFTNSKDIYSVIHNGKVDKILLSNLKYANLDLFNPITSQGWYKLGAFDFNGTGNEYVKVLKTSDDSTLLDCIMFEEVKLDGTILNRLIVTPNSYNGSFLKNTKEISLEQKIRSTKKVVGLSPNNNGLSVVTSSKNGSTIYSRALYSREKYPFFTWNPCITESGDYDLYYFVYYIPNGNGSFEISSNGGKVITPVLQSDLKAQQQYFVGNYRFKGALNDEIIEMKGLNRASDITLEKSEAEGAILKQTVVTAHPYFIEYSFLDSKNLSNEHDLSEMVRKNFIKPISDLNFGVNLPMTIEEFSNVLRTILDTNMVRYTTLGLFNHFPKSVDKNKQITIEQASQFFLNAMEMSERYLNVHNYFSKKNNKYIFSNSIDSNYLEGFQKMQDMFLINDSILYKSKINRYLNRYDATLLLKQFNEQILCSGPPSKSDWDITFYDEFDGDKMDWNKWIADDAVRFKEVSAKWKENCVVENGIFKGYNYMDNHTVPYSSGNIHSNFRQTYGFFEARYKYPDKAYGSHSSFWTSSRGGDFNYNEGTYPNSVSNNNYFLKSDTNFHDFATLTNLSHDFHTFSGYLNSQDLFYGMDGKITWEVKDYPRFYSDKIDPNSSDIKSTNFPYNIMMSTVVTYFDGPLDRDRIDGSFMACDWIRLYKEIKWDPAIDTILLQKSNNEKETIFELKFNKPMDTASISKSISIFSNLDSPLKYVITPINRLRYKILIYHKPLKDIKISIKISKSAIDLRGNSLLSDYIYNVVRK